MASKLEQAKNTLKKLKEKKTALDKQIAVAEKVLTNEKKIAEIAVKAAKAGATAKKVAGKASSAKKAVKKAASTKKALTSKLSTLKKR